MVRIVLNKMIFELNPREDKFIEDCYKKAMKELNGFFGIDWVKNTPALIVVANRKSFDMILKMKTEEWHTAESRAGRIFLLSPKSYKEESCHPYSKEKYFSMIKHELCHQFQDVLSNYNYKPLWLSEGLATYLSNQMYPEIRPEKFSRFLSFYDKGGREVYNESGFAVELLIRKFGKRKLLRLIKSLKKINSEKKFKEKFKEIYKFNLSYREINKLWGK